MAKNITTFFPYHIRTIFIMIFTTWVVGLGLNTNLCKILQFNQAFKMLSNLKKNYKTFFVTTELYKLKTWMKKYDIPYITIITYIMGGTCEFVDQTKPCAVHSRI